MVEHLDEIGSPESYPHYAVGWAHAMCTPYQWTKQVASHWGGTRNATIVRWPGGAVEAGGLRHQFHHVIDVAPTVLAATRIPTPSTVHGVTQESMHGVDMSYTFGAGGADAPDRPRDAVLRDVLQPWHLPQRLVGGHQTPHAMELRTHRACRSTTTCGSCTTARPTGRRPTISPPSSPTSSTSCSGCS